jgi:hypothetical protein
MGQVGCHTKLDRRSEGMGTTAKTHTRTHTHTHTVRTSVSSSGSKQQAAAPCFLPSHAEVCVLVDSARDKAGHV